MRCQDRWKFYPEIISFPLVWHPSSAARDGGSGVLSVPGIVGPQAAMRPILPLALALLLTGAASLKAQSSRDLLLEAKVILEQGANFDDEDVLLQARTAFEDLLGDEGMAMLAHYYAASAASELANVLDESGRSGVRRTILGYVNYAIEHFEAAVAIDSSFAEGWLLLSASYAQKITVKPLSAVGLGRRFNRAMNRAEELEPDNPRVVLLRAITDYNLPRIVGGNKGRAVDGFLRSAKLYQEETVTDPALPSWGHDQAYARLGIAYMDRHKFDEAREAFNRALVLNPDYQWVSQTLLPSLDEAEAAGR